MLMSKNRFFELQASRLQLAFLLALTTWIAVIIVVIVRLARQPPTTVINTPIIVETDPPLPSSPPKFAGTQALMFEALPQFAPNVTGLIYWTYDSNFQLRRFAVQSSFLYTDSTIEAIKVTSMAEYGYRDMLPYHFENQCFSLRTKDMIVGTSLQVAMRKAGKLGFVACPVFHLDYYLNGGHKNDLQGYVSAAWNQPKTDDDVEKIKTLLKNVAVSIAKE